MRFITSANPTNDDIIGNYLFKSYKAFENRMMQIEEIFHAKDALATLDYIYRDRANLKELQQEELLRKIAEYSREHPGRQFDSRPLNEAALVLLSAYLEAFIEDLHSEAIRQLLHEKIESSGVLEALIENAHKQFGNPRSDKIGDLFKTCGIKNLISKLHPEIEIGEINQFVDLRNKIAHGERVDVRDHDVEKSVKSVRKFAEGCFLAVKQEIVAMDLRK